MKHDPGQERLRVPVTKRREMPSAVSGRGHVCLDLEPEQPTTGQFSEEVHFKPGLLLTNVIVSTPSRSPAVIRLVDQTFGAAAAGETAPAVGAEGNDSITRKATAKGTRTMILQSSQP